MAKPYVQTIRYLGTDLFHNVNEAYPECTSFIQAAVNLPVSDSTATYTQVNAAIVKGGVTPIQGLQQYHLLIWDGAKAPVVVHPPPDLPLFDMAAKTKAAKKKKASKKPTAKRIAVKKGTPK